MARNEASERGSGVAIVLSAGQAAHNTLSGNTGGDGTGVRVDMNSTVTLINNLVASHTVGISNTTPASSTVQAQYTLFDGNGLNYGAGVSSVNPVPGPAALRANYHLRSESGALDRALPLAWVTTDIDGEPRPYGLAPDVGADEKSSACDVYALNSGGGDAGDCTDANHPCRTVQYALGQAITGDRVCVANSILQPGPSVYTGTINLNKSVTLDGAWEAACAGVLNRVCSFTPVTCAPANVILDGQRAGRVVNVSGHASPTLRCFTVTGGQALVSGGGLRSQDAAPIIANNVFTNNVAGSYGGGIEIASGTAVITANDILSNSVPYGGGGVLCAWGTTVWLHGNQIAGNQANYGGGIDADRAAITATANRIVNNRATSAVLFSGEGGLAVGVNNVVANNTGVGFDVLHYRAELAHNTIVSNTDTGVLGRYTATLTMTNNILAGHAGGSISKWDDGTTVVATNNLFWRNPTDPITGTGAVLADPMLASDGVHLGAGSAAINRGGAHVGDDGC